MICNIDRKARTMSQSVEGLFKECVISKELFSTLASDEQTRQVAQEALGITTKRSRR